ncbi:hypothetical protein MCHIJ_43240 [Mycolicibacterium chitae]|uniref:HNH endonuclease n=1 Tax=Mycolicibacterium chitae TaxID=1792 RepID=A0A448I7M3_MYCCI|nr:HNH endonuclease signature motif containing protein [Mycolicibacterium chitae]MCV7104218.1 HNH endonuclease [Mycolicibacterium chitae]BBZ04887.1 hypothetical protein MCHIJ_43240 [Mycolicibacterium chitae]VEG48511.1 HNH endonuclease [Mycolicibacterium chitae]
MIARPCTGCGDIIATGSRCADCRPTRASTPPRSHVAYANNGKWKNLSKRLRKASPFCEFCGGTDHLQVDHIIPESIAPELAYTEENLRVLDRDCNNPRQATYTHEEAQTVLARLHATYRRRPTRAGRDRIAAAERALADLGGGPKAQVRPTAGKAQRALHTLGGYG